MKKRCSVRRTLTRTSQRKWDQKQNWLLETSILYHRKLRSLVAIELKVGPFIPEYIGKMQFYLSVLNDTVRLEDENPSIGIILCREKNRTVVEYALKDTNKPINVAAYKNVSKLPKELKDELPSPNQIALLLEHISKKWAITQKWKKIHWKSYGLEICKALRHWLSKIPAKNRLKLFTRIGS